MLFASFLMLFFVWDYISMTDLSALNNICLIPAVTDPAIKIGTAILSYSLPFGGVGWKAN